jgi:hypothetical protein
MISFVIRSDHDKERLIAAIKLADWSFKIYLQPLFPKAKPDQYNTSLALYTNGLQILWEIQMSGLFTKI